MNRHSTKVAEGVVYGKAPSEHRSARTPKFVSEERRPQRRQRPPMRRP